MEASNVYSVVWPSGQREVKEAAAAKRLDGLEGKVIAELWSWTFKGDIMFEAFEAELPKRYPGVKFISWREFGEIHGANEREVLAALPEKLKALGVDGAITGVGGGGGSPAGQRRTCARVSWWKSWGSPR